MIQIQSYRKDANIIVPTAVTAVSFSFTQRQKSSVQSVAVRILQSSFLASPQAAIRAKANLLLHPIAPLVKFLEAAAV